MICRALSVVDCTAFPSSKSSKSTEDSLSGPNVGTSGATDAASSRCLPASASGPGRRAADATDKLALSSF